VLESEQERDLVLVRTHISAFYVEVMAAITGLMRFLQPLQEPEHFWHWRQEKVAKIVKCGDPDRTKVAGIGSGGLFLIKLCS
jgi:hypothetical protein